MVSVGRFGVLKALSGRKKNDTKSWSVTLSYRKLTLPEAVISFHTDKNGLFVCVDSTLRSESRYEAEDQSRRRARHLLRADC
jgi:hypothetical protein